MSAVTLRLIIIIIIKKQNENTKFMRKIVLKRWQGKKNNFTRTDFMAEKAMNVDDTFILTLRHFT